MPKGGESIKSNKNAKPLKEVSQKLKTQIWETIIQNDKEFKIVFFKKKVLWDAVEMEFDDFKSECVIAVYKRMLNWNPTRANLKTFFNRSVAYSALTILENAFKKQNKDKLLIEKLSKEDKQLFRDLKNLDENKGE